MKFLLQWLNSAVIADNHRQYVNKWAWPSSTETLFMDTNWNFMYCLHVTKYFSLFFFPQPFKNSWAAKTDNRPDFTLWLSSADLCCPKASAKAPRNKIFWGLDSKWPKVWVGLESLLETHAERLRRKDQKARVTPACKGFSLDKIWGSHGKSS